MLASFIASIGIRGFLMAGAVAAVSFLAWDYKSTKLENADLRLEIAAAKEAQRFADLARDVAIEEAERQAERADTVKTRTITIRKRADGKDPAADILLDTINSLSNDASGIQASTD